jgi:hypothetical protein
LFKRCIFIFFLFPLKGCIQKEDLKVQRSFYFWKSVFRLSQKERNILEDLSVKQLYIKFFDLSWDPEKKAARPIAKLQVRDLPPPGIFITPVVFITNESLSQTGPLHTDSLATDISRLIESMSSSLPLSGEIQIDCDWTSGTRETYFSLLSKLKQLPFFKGKTLSATIRLHQLKFISQSGIPPVDKGLVMCYNMGNLRHPQTKNSIIESEELKKYIRNLNHYPLRVDIALPAFDWFVKFRGNHFAGLIHGFNLPDSFRKTERTLFERDTMINGMFFKKGDWLRYEASDIDVIRACIYLIRQKLKKEELNVILYHLDETNLNRYSTYELETIYSSFL